MRWTVVALISLLSCADRAPPDPTTDADADAEAGDAGDAGSSTSTEDETAASEAESTGVGDGDGDGDGDDDAGFAGFTQVDGGVCGGCVPGNLLDCPEGEKCTVTGFESECSPNSCVPVTGALAPGDACTITTPPEYGLDDCRNGAFCLPAPGTPTAGVCVELCDLAGDPCPTGQTCNSFLDGVMPVCADQCHPFGPACPAADTSCLTSGGRFGCVPSTPLLDAGYDEACLERDCGPGLICREAGTCNEIRCCAALCQLATPSCPQPGQTCVPFADPWPGFEDVGVCE